VVARKETYKHINTVKKQQKKKTEKKQRASGANKLNITVYFISA